MSEPHDAEPDGRSTPGGDQPPGVPRWVKVLLAVVGVLLLALVVSLLLDGGHGPGMHGPGRPGR